VASYRLAPAASRDFEHILHQGLEQFGIEQARRYRTGLSDAFSYLSAFPRAARLRDEIEPPVRVHRFGSHVILYDIVDDDSIVILRIRHGREDWQADASSN
jgi:toxin ParE1/3/4